MKTQETHTPPLDETRVERNLTPSHRHQDDHLRSINPADGCVVGETRMTSPSEIDILLERALEAQRAWRRRPLKFRIEKGRELFCEALSWRRELLELIGDETGKSSLEARWELWKTCEEVEDILSGAQPMLQEEEDARWWQPGRKTLWRWQPRGLVLIIASGYEPLQTTLAPAIAALVAGNAVVVVGDRRSPLTAQSITNIATSIGIADHLWTGVVGTRRLTDSLADRVDAVVSYGSSMVTRRLARRQGDRMIPVYGRWPTRDAMIVLADADLRRAARAAVCSSCSGGGRRRRSLRRIYVQQSIIDPFIDAVVEEVSTLRQGHRDGDGPGERGGIEVGPLFDAEQLETMESLVDEATGRGARLVAGGRIRPRCRGLFFEPTVLTGVDESMRLWNENIPGPVVAIAEVQAPAEAIRRICEIPGYGAVSLFTRNRGLARDLAKRLQAPVVGINEVVHDVPAHSPSIRGTLSGPLDPVGADRLRALSQTTLLVERRFRRIPKIVETRAPKQMERVLEAGMSLIHRRDWARRVFDAVLPGG